MNSFDVSFPLDVDLGRMSSVTDLLTVSVFGHTLQLMYSVCFNGVCHGSLSSFMLYVVKKKSFLKDLLRQCTLKNL